MPYEPSKPGGAPLVVVPPDGQMTLDDLMAEVPAQRAQSRLGPELDHRVIHRVLMALLEVHAGRRPVAQLGSWLTAAVLRVLRARARASGPRYLLRHIHICRPAENAVEVCGSAHAAERTRAVAARFEHGNDGWRCTSFAVL